MPSRNTTATIRKAARAALDQAEMVVAMSPYKHGMPITLMCCCRLRHLPKHPAPSSIAKVVRKVSMAAVKPLGETRPAWKVLRVLGNLLGLTGFDYETSEAIRTEIIGEKSDTGFDLTSRLNNFAKLQPQAAAQNAGAGLERVADVPIYFTDAIVRRAESLQETADAQPPEARLSTALAQKLGVKDGDQVNVTQGQGSVALATSIDKTLPDNVVRIAAAHASTISLGAMFGPISVEKA